MSVQGVSRSANIIEQFLTTRIIWRAPEFRIVDIVRPFDPFPREINKAEYVGDQTYRCQWIHEGITIERSRSCCKVGEQISGFWYYNRNSNMKLQAENMLLTADSAFYSDLKRATIIAFATIAGGKWVVQPLAGIHPSSHPIKTSELPPHLILQELVCEPTLRGTFPSGLILVL